MGFAPSRSVLLLLILGFGGNDAFRGLSNGNRRGHPPAALIGCPDFSIRWFRRRLLWGASVPTGETGGSLSLKGLYNSTNGEADDQDDQSCVKAPARSDEAITASPESTSPLQVYPRVHSVLCIDSKQAAVCSRTIPITSSWSITVWEWQSVSPVIETYWQVEQQGLQVSKSRGHGNRRDMRQQQERQSLMLDPFGLVTWPGSVVATLELMRNQALVKGSVVFVIGAGVGVEAQAAAALGAKRVIATDVHPTTLKLLEHGVQQATGIDPKRVESRIWDLFGSDAVPPDVDLIVCADVLYNDKLACQLINRICEVYETTSDFSDDWAAAAADRRNATFPTTNVSSAGVASGANATLRETTTRKAPATLIVDSQRFCHGFEHDLNAGLKRSGRRGKVAWESRYLPSFTGSGILVEDDQTYDVKARVLWIGL